jgi:spermidine synthase
VSRITDKGNVSICLSNLKIESRIVTQFARVILYAHPQLGRVLTLNGEVQHVEAWAPLYHEPLVHIPAAFVAAPRSALLLGGASFFAAAELLKYSSIERVLMLDRDAELVRLMTHSYEHAAEARADSRLEIRFEDIFEAIPRLRERFDLVINDAVDLLAENCTNGFSLLGNALATDGICADVVYRHIFERDYANTTLRLLLHTVGSVMALIFVPEYPGVLHLLTVWGANPRLRQDLKMPANLEQLKWTEHPGKNPCEYFDPRFLGYYLHLPGYLRRVIGDARGMHA